MPCPWYKDGFCHSPALEAPSEDPVVNAICLGSEAVYKKCRLYREPGAPTQQVRQRSGRFGKPLMLIHPLNRQPSSQCEFFVVEVDESGSYLGACKVLGRYLTRYEVPLCEKYWQDCPYRKIGLIIESRQ